MDGLLFQSPAHAVDDLGNLRHRDLEIPGVSVEFLNPLHEARSSGWHGFLPLEKPGEHEEALDDADCPVLEAAHKLNFLGHWGINPGTRHLFNQSECSF